MTGTTRSGVLPAPPDDRMAAYTAGGPGHDPFVVIHVYSWRSIFRLTVNMLSQQSDISQAARGVLVDMRDDMTPERFDPMALEMLGKDHYDRLKDRFERSWECVACYNDVNPGRKYAPTNDATVICANCCKGHPEYVRQLKVRADV